MKETKYKSEQREHQVSLYDNGFYGKNVQNGGFFTVVTKKGTLRLDNLNDVLKPECSIYNMYGGIIKPAMQYFAKNAVSWWNEELDGYHPTGHLLSSQINCLNHLFMIRTDKTAILAMLNKIQNKIRFVNVNKVPIDNKDDEGFISFEFVYNNEVLLHETRRSRGSKCTSIDAMIYAEDDKQKKWLIPIEWKYTEMYEKRTPAKEESLKRYPELVNNDSNLVSWIPEVFKYDPSYELARQTLLVERTILSRDRFFPVDDYLHFFVTPTKNFELIKLVETDFVPHLKDFTKFNIVDPKDFVLPALETDGKYDKLKKYLSIRYW